MPDRIEHRDDRKRHSRSRSPSKQEHHAHRTRSPHRHHHRHKRSTVKPDAPKELPYGARQLTKRDFAVFKPMFALYLDIQKQKVLDDLDDVEAKGRWKSFIGKWNHGELAEGWYDPSTLQKAIASSAESQAPSRDATSKEQGTHPNRDMEAVERPSKNSPESGSESADSIGPTLPGKEGRSRSSKKGPSIPTTDDLQLKRETDQEDALAHLSSLRTARTAERKAQTAALDELAPRAPAGTFERRLENKAAVNATMKTFRDRSPGGGAAEVPDSDLMGGGDGDGISEFRVKKQEFERKKNEREIRKEEFLRARAAEREERVAHYAAREERTVGMLREMARERFGG